MNPDRRFPFAERVAGIIIRIQLWIESFFPQPQAELLDVVSLELVFSVAWLEEFRKQMEGENK